MKHETDMPHCWCNPRKEVMPNGNMVILHNVMCEECGKQVEDDNVAVKIYLCKKCDAKNWIHSPTEIIDSINKDGVLQIEPTNDGKPHICNTFQTYIGGREGIRICLKCNMPVDSIK